MIQHLGTINISTKFHDQPSNIYKDISLQTHKKICQNQDQLEKSGDCQSIGFRATQSIFYLLRYFSLEESRWSDRPTLSSPRATLLACHLSTTHLKSQWDQSLRYFERRNKLLSVQTGRCASSVNLHPPPPPQSNTIMWTFKTFLPRAHEITASPKRYCHLPDLTFICSCWALSVPPPKPPLAKSEPILQCKKTKGTPVCVVRRVSALPAAQDVTQLETKATRFISQGMPEKTFLQILLPLNK